MLRVLVVSKIFPNAKSPAAAPFNRQQFSALARRPGVSVEVLATLPWFPGSSLVKKWSRASEADGVPRTDVIAGLPVCHPRTLYVPRLPALSAPLYAASLLPEVARRRGQVDVVLGSFAYPDGAAAVALGRFLKAPVVVKVHGSDLNVIGQMRGPRAILRQALPRVDRLVVVSKPLAEVAAELGVPREHIDVIGNGVDGEVFQPRDRRAAQKALDLPHGQKWLVYVGRLEKTKGVLDLLEAFASLAASHPEISLALVGDGAARAECEAAARPFGDRVRLPGVQPLDRVATWMAACDALVLPSWAEGTPNVLLEALASGRRVVATNVGGCPDVVSEPALGELVPAREPAALAAALVSAASTSYDPADIARRGARGGWDESAAKLAATLEKAVARYRTHRT
jgi:glycosyltransferase involved in cell wall biosynthesis